jgi:hypothetical protein
VVNFTLRPIYPWEKRPQYPVNRRHKCSWQKILTLLPQGLSPLAYSIFTWIRPAILSFVPPWSSCSLPLCPSGLQCNTNTFLGVCFHPFLKRNNDDYSYDFPLSPSDHLHTQYVHNNQPSVRPFRPDSAKRHIIEKWHINKIFPLEKKTVEKLFIFSVSKIRHMFSRRFTTVHYSSLSWARAIQFKAIQSISWRSISTLYFISA